MTSEILSLLTSISLTSSAVIVLLLCLRLPLRRWAGSNLVYQSWLLLPLVLLAMCLPHPVQQKTVLFLPITEMIVSTVTVPGQPTSTWPAVMNVIWLAGVVLSLCWFILQHRWFVRSLGKLSKHADFYLAEHEHAGPAMMGLWHTRIIMPADFFDRYSEHEQDLILRHEYIHQQRRDVCMNTLFALAQCLFWFNPLLHLAARCFRLDQELACDALVIRHQPAARRSYAEAMLKTQLNLQTGVLACHWQSHHPLKERIMNLSQNYPSPIRRLASLILLCSIGSFSAYQAWAISPQAADTASSASTASTTQADIAGSYSIASVIKIDGKTFQPRVISKLGETASIRIDETGAKWDFKLTVTENKEGKDAKDAQIPKVTDAALLTMVISKNGKILAQPRLLVGLGQSARIKQEKPDHQEDFDISMVTSIVK